LISEQIPLKPSDRASQQYHQNLTFMSWSCTSCTFRNDSPLLTSCIVCGATKQPTSTALIVEASGWTWYNHFRDAPINAWTQSVRSSIISPSQCHWIAIKNPKHQHTSELYQSSEQLTLTMAKLNTDVLQPMLLIARKKAAVKEAARLKIVAAAKAISYTSGKWCCFASRKDVDRCWEKIAIATFEGELGSSAKVATSSDANGASSSSSSSSSSFTSDVLICIYCNFTNEIEVQRILRVLLEMKSKDNLLMRV
jgi:hypothetical protein